MIIGEHSRGNDLEVNPLRSKQLTNIRTTSKDEAVRLTPPRQMTLEVAIAYVQDDEQVEVTPKSIRLRKVMLDPNARKRADRAAEAADASVGHRAPAPSAEAPSPPAGGERAGRGGPLGSSRSMNRWRRALAVYADPKIFLITVMGFSSGLPLLLTLSTLSYWLAKLGVSKTSIGLFAAVGVPYSFKFLWAPLLDQIRPPFLGRRRGWAIIIQAALALAILAMGFTDPAVNPWWTALAAVVVAFLSASQDIVIDAYRIEILPLEEQGAGSAATQVGYRFGLLAAGAGALAAGGFRRLARGLRHPRRADGHRRHRLPGGAGASGPAAAEARELQPTGSCAASWGRWRNSFCAAARS